MFKVIPQIHAQQEDIPQNQVHPSVDQASSSEAQSIKGVPLKKTVVYFASVLLYIFAGIGSHFVPTVTIPVFLFLPVLIYVPYKLK